MNSYTVVGFVFVIYGGLNVVMPKELFRFRANIAKSLFSITYKASKKTYKTYQILGALYMLIGFLFIVGVFA
ncbi:hypothetical protein A2801_04070 [Candidatus Woesebacteria bacterium RIFCSPHIGHO2_01_FULL_41_10]|uniref:Uncharacterized protein n=1 Tax=Candidatus Woesebacteria bacterium RIFCSPHIGHO2_01_FULL_41_10 TaxID=1802500 RepID=A0A1F7YNW4_9BACT|nr:MAG: hypothetical protein A2801_04070 [Candidatus Woesebacteria bacterium RIFCSPHIGHO2_01_FULL_41_10]